MFGTWSGHVTDDAGTVHQVEAIQGFARGIPVPLVIGDVTCEETA